MQLCSPHFAAGASRLAFHMVGGRGCHSAAHCTWGWYLIWGVTDHWHVSMSSYLGTGTRLQNGITHKPIWKP
jgi:hypothetical protein